ncbi:hypothetical protein ACFPME_08735 [Rhodanobacter umsongensis]|uniref:Uncharacterized protein n=1 Tax=Rhodanobacter umsongensis TaxID=633153 RepID=A0ABW0JLQ3_9GAMM
MVVVVVAKERLMAPAGNGAHPAETGAECVRAGVESGDMRSTLEGMLRCGQQIHLQLSAVRPRRHGHERAARPLRRGAVVESNGMAGDLPDGGGAVTPPAMGTFA